ncbi:hypothetical protein Tco_0256543 [Tanacetum coccineum]
MIRSFRSSWVSREWYRSISFLAIIEKVRRKEKKVHRKWKNPEQIKQWQKAKMIAPETICIFYYSKSKAKSKKRLLFIGKRGKDTMDGKLSHDTLQRKCVDKSQATCRTLMTQTTFKSSIDKLAWQILDWGDMMRSRVITRTPKKLLGTKLNSILITAEVTFTKPK